MKEKFAAAGPNELENSENQSGKIAGFWQGLWHGIIAPIAFIISLFNENVGVYESHNNGNWYNFGFIIGLMMVFGGNAGAGTKSTMKKPD
jgi:uncharacterized membrane protein